MISIKLLIIFCFTGAIFSINCNGNGGGADYIGFSTPSSSSRDSDRPLQPNYTLGVLQVSLISSMNTEDDIIKFIEELKTKVLSPLGILVVSYADSDPAIEYECAGTNLLIRA